MSNGTRLEQNNNEPNQYIGGNLYQKPTKREMADLDRGNIRVFEKGVHDQSYGDPEDVQTTFEQTRAEQVETKRLFDIAKKMVCLSTEKLSISLEINCVLKPVNAKFFTMKKNHLFTK